jgi:23S rRNA pseudouridine2605 synthase
LGDLPDGAVEEVKTRALREQIGERIAAVAGADFSGPLVEREASVEKAPFHQPALRAPAPDVRPSREQVPRASKGGRRGAPDRKPGKSGRSSSNFGSQRGRTENAPSRQGRPAKGGSHRPLRDDGARRPRDDDKKSPHRGGRPYKGRRDR